MINRGKNTNNSKQVVKWRERNRLKQANIKSSIIYLSDLQFVEQA